VANSFITGTTRLYYKAFYGSNCCRVVTRKCLPLLFTFTQAFDFQARPEPTYQSGAPNVRRLPWLANIRLGWK
jgi:hypothetical protein